MVATATPPSTSPVSEARRSVFIDREAPAFRQGRPHVFNNDGDAHALSGGHAALSRMMEGYWTAFAAAGDPNVSGEAAARVPWRRFTKDEPAVLSISDTPFTKSDFAEEHKCAFWEQSGLAAPTW